MSTVSGFEIFVFSTLPFLVLLVGGLWGRRAEKLHFADLLRREKIYDNFPIYNVRKAPSGYEPFDAGLVSGAVVISEDAGKRFLARLKNMVGGNIKSYETLLERARREARLRMLEQASAAGANAVVNVRYDTSDLSSQRETQASPVGIEVLVFATALKLRKVDM